MRDVKISPVWPLDTRRLDDGALAIGGVSMNAIASTYGTPTYVFDERTLRQRARSFREAFAEHYPASSSVVYAGKALITIAILRILRDEGLGLDVVSGGELHAGLLAGMPPARISLHGNNKSRAEIEAAIDAGIGKIVIDNDDEIDLLGRTMTNRPGTIAVMLRLNPGVDVHTHRKISTGVADSKFGVPISTGQAEAAVARLVAMDGVRLVGYHVHVGSQLSELDAHTEAIGDVVRFARRMRDRHGASFAQFSPGGGFGIAYQDEDALPAIDAWARAISSAIVGACEAEDLPLPALTMEPGRSIVGPAGVALYTVGARKILPGLRTYVSVDGGMADNIRPALYDARYEAAIANRRAAGQPQRVTIAGKFCESGDVLIDGIDLPPLEPGDLLAVPGAGAYTIAMASNYNLAPRPALVLVKDGHHRLMRARETFADLLRLDVDGPGKWIPAPD